MQVQRYSLLLALVVPASVAWPDDPARLGVEVSPALAQVRPVVEGRRFVRLPTLEYEFRIEADCAAGHDVKSVSISIADTRKTLTGADFPADGPVDTTITLPALQIPPLAIDAVCTDPDPAADDEPTVIRDVVTAQVSLRCAGPEGETITYSSRSLDVALTCERDQEDQSAPVSTDR
jgi:hypothetical protein